jgi:hypothetical protein
LLGILSGKATNGSLRMTVRRLRSRIQKTNAIVYFDEILDEQLRQHIESIVARVEGVTDAHFNETQRQLMIVDFDPNQTDSAVILSRVKRRHLHAQLL